MPNNFKLFGDYYVSKAGNDSNNGLTPETPKRTIQAALSLFTPGVFRTIIIGAGEYQENLSYTIISNNSRITLKGDGEVILNGLNSKILNFSVSAQRVFGWVFENIKFINFFSPSSYISLAIADFRQSTSFTNCFFVNSRLATSFTGGGSTTTWYFLNCLFVNSTYTQTSSNLSTPLLLNKCVLINSRIGSEINPILSITHITNTYINNNSNIVLSSSPTFNWNNLEGSITMNVSSSISSGIVQDIYGRYYDLSQSGTGGNGELNNPFKRNDTLLKPFYFDVHRILYPTFNINSISENPKFNSVKNLDFTLQSDSPNIGRANNSILSITQPGNSIGLYNYTIAESAKGNSFSGSEAIIDASLIFNNDNYIVSGSELTGSIISSPIFISSEPKLIEKIKYNANFQFNKDINSPYGSNMNVMDAETYTSASLEPAANPDRLTYYMRWSTKNYKPIIDSDWDNGNICEAGTFSLFEWNTRPSFDYNGFGNGDARNTITYYPMYYTPNYVKASYIQLKIILRNNYLI